MKASGCFLYLEFHVEVSNIYDLKEFTLEDDDGDEN